jgi:hypothetical protein
VRIVVFGQKAQTVRTSGPHTLFEAQSLGELLDGTPKADMILLDLNALRSIMRVGDAKRATSAKASQAFDTARISEALDTLRRSNAAAKRILAPHG